MGVIWALGALSVIGTVWQGAGRAVVFMFASAGALALIGFQELSVAVIGLFMVPSLMAGTAALVRRAHPFHVLMFAAADLMLVCALLLSHKESTGWVLPAAGGWGRGTALLALAAVLRLSVGLVAADRSDMGIGTTGWWMGIVLAWWAGPPALPILGAGAAVLAASSLIQDRDAVASSLSYAGGAVAVLAGLGADPALLGIVAAGGVATMLGSPVLGILSWGAVPLSVATMQPLPTGIQASLIMLIVPILLVLVVESALVRRGPFSGGRVTGAAAVAAALLLADMRHLVWLAAAVTIAMGATLMFTRRTPSPPPAIEAGPHPPVYPLVTTLLALAISLVAGIILSVLALQGMSTGFL